MELRHYQRDAVDAIIASLASAKNPILAMPTGGGKTAVGVAVVSRLSPRRTLWLAHREELVRQARDRFTASGLRAGIIMAGWPAEPTAPVQVASVQTLVRREVPEDVDLLIADEAHLAAAKGWTTLIKSVSAPRVGLTATPARLDGKPLGDLFDRIIEPVSARELIDDGFLMEPEVYVPDSPDLSGVKVVRGDFDQRALGSRMNTAVLVGNIVKTWLSLAKGRKTVAFAVTVEHSKSIADAFNSAAIPALHIDATTPKAERRSALKALAEGTVTVLVQVGILQEGWDLPSLECVVVARPTAALVFHRQVIGRGMRACDSKDSFLLLDHAGNSIRLGSVTTPVSWSLTGRLKPEPKRRLAKPCPKCFFLLSPAARICSKCGHVIPVRGRQITEVEGDLRPIGAPRPTYTFEEREAYWNSVESERLIKGYDPKWADRRYLGRFHQWPLLAGRALVNDVAPSPDQRKAVFKEFARIGIRDGRKPGYAAARFKSSFGQWPPWPWTMAVEDKMFDLGLTHLLSESALTRNRLRGTHNLSTQVAP